MRREYVSPRSKAVGWAIIAATLVLPVILCPIQGLPRARIGLSGQVDTSPDEPVTLTVQLPRGYGLSRAERRDGWAELNEAQSTRVVLDGSPFEVRLPPARYCVTRFWWQDTPPPLLWLNFTLSDAPDERYLVWATPEQAHYEVLGNDDARRPKSGARWKLHLGAYHQDLSGEAWLLDVRLERQVPDDAPGIEGRASAGVAHANGIEEGAA